MIYVTGMTQDEVAKILQEKQVPAVVWNPFPGASEEVEPEDRGLVGVLEVHPLKEHPPGMIVGVLKTGLAGQQRNPE